MDSLQKHFDLFEEAPTKSLDHPKADTSQMDVLRFESTLGGANFHARASLFVYFQAAVSTLTFTFPMKSLTSSSSVAGQL